MYEIWIKLSDMALNFSPSDELKNSSVLPKHLSCGNFWFKFVFFSNREKYKFKRHFIKQSEADKKQ